MHSSAYLVGRGCGGLQVRGGEVAARWRRGGGEVAPLGARRDQLPGLRGVGHRCGCRGGCSGGCRGHAEARMRAARAHGATSCC